MQILKSFLLVLLLPAFSYSQQLSGIWTGVLSNDSLTARKDQSFEIAFTEYRGKVYGYTYSTFIVNDTLYYIIKRVKGEITGNVCMVKDDEVITHNFQKKQERGIRVVYTFRREQQDSAWVLEGNWKTNATKKFYSISGNVSAGYEKDISRSKLYDHLGDLNLQQTLAFNNPKDTKSEKKIPIVTNEIKSVVKTNVKPVDDKPKAVNSTLPKQEVKNDIAKVGQKPSDNKQVNAITKADIKNPADTNAVIQKPGPKNDIAKAEQKPVDNKLVNDIIKAETKKTADTNALAQKPGPKNDIANAEQKPVDNKLVNDIIKAETKKTADTNALAQKPGPKNDIAKVEQKPVDNKRANDIPKADTKKPADINTIVQKPDTKSDIAAVDKKAIEKNPAEDFIYAELKKTERRLRPAAEMVSERTSAPSETIYFKSDSLVLALYDNGEVDGDTVSVIMNGEVIIEKQVLKSSAFRKTIYLAPDESDSVLLILYAENLGLYPPNTGLMVVKDGEESFYVRFKADYDQNAAILLRRKYK